MVHKPELKHEDYTELATAAEPEVSQEAPPKKPLIAYKVGQTDLGHDEISGVSQILMAKMTEYDVYRANCQYFVVHLLNRILKHPGDRSVFFGTARQIAAWDLRRSNRFKVYDNIDKGFCIFAPRLGA